MRLLQPERTQGFPPTDTTRQLLSLHRVHIGSALVLSYALSFKLRAFKP